MVSYDMDQKELDHMINKLDLECIDTVPGCLLDNLMLSSQNLLILATEKYLNCWSSCYHVLIAETYEEDKQLRNEWEEIQPCI